MWRNRGRDGRAADGTRGRYRSAPFDAAAITTGRVCPLVSRPRGPPIVCHVVPAAAPCCWVRLGREVFCPESVSTPTRRHRRCRWRPRGERRETTAVRKAVRFRRPKRARVHRRTDVRSRPTPVTDQHGCCASNGFQWRLGRRDGFGGLEPIC